MKYSTVTIAMTALLLGTAAANAGEAVPDYIRKAVADVGRPPGDLARDADRKPAESIAVSGMKPGQIVVELVPGGGYFTRIFSKIVGPTGKVYAYSRMPANPQGGGGPA